MSIPITEALVGAKVIISHRIGKSDVLEYGSTEVREISPSGKFVNFSSNNPEDKSVGWVPITEYEVEEVLK